jgi:hypothetical protein
VPSKWLTFAAGVAVRASPSWVSSRTAEVISAATIRT